MSNYDPEGQQPQQPWGNPQQQPTWPQQQQQQYPPAGYGPQFTPQPPKRHGVRNGCLIGLGVMVGLIVLVVIVVAVAAGGGNSPQTSGSNPSAPVSQPTHTAKPKPIGTVSERNALRAARAYLATQAFSKKGLIAQLHSKNGDGYPLADAKWAVNHLHANWFAQAVRSAKEYLRTQAFSRAGLISQLDSKNGEQFTVAQATYAANKVGL